MAAWRAGIVVVAAAGDEGPAAVTIDMPGNVPYVITTGALTDNYTPYDLSDDRLAPFSSTRPTFEGFVKPELVAPGGHMVASMPAASYLANLDPGFMMPTEQLFTMSGTSTHHRARGRLAREARVQCISTGRGLINAVSAVNSSATGCANVGLDIAADLAGTQHFGGPANQDANGNYYVMNMAGSTWGIQINSGCNLSR